jgi:hypothetical protein
MSVEITAVHMEPSNANSNEAIASVRWVNPADGASDVSTKATMVDWIDNKGGTAYTNNGKRATVGTVHPQGRAPYLQTHADGEWNNNLLSLPRF